MKTQTLLKIAAIIFIVLLCVGFAFIYSPQYNKMKANNNNLYSLVPPSAHMVYEVGDVYTLLGDIEKLNNNEFEFCSKEFNLLFYLNSYLNTILEDQSQSTLYQPKKILFSFHTCDTVNNQVIYSYFDKKDYQFIDRFLSNYCKSMLPTTQLNYKGEDIRIYSLLDDSPISCYFTSNFIVISRSLDLIQEVIEAQFTGDNLANDVSFKELSTPKRQNQNTLFICADNIKVGPSKEQMPFGGWIELIPHVNERSISFSGICHDFTQRNSFVNLLRQQKTINDIPGVRLPSTTYYYQHYAINDLASFSAFVASMVHSSTITASSGSQNNNLLYTLLKDEPSSDALACHFTTDKNRAATVACVKTSDISRSSDILQRISNQNSQIESLGKLLSINTLKKIHVYKVSDSSDVLVLGLDSEQKSMYVCLYKDMILMSESLDDVQSYIDSLEEEKVLISDSVYKGNVSMLPDVYNYMTMVNFTEVFDSVRSCEKFIPNYFLTNSDFFKNFDAFAQFSCLNKEVFVNFVIYDKLEY